MAKIGVLALQGGVEEHINVFRSLDADVREIRLPDELEGLQGLVIPGGESMAIANLMDSFGLREPIKESVKQGMGVWGTCAGLILIANEVDGGSPTPLCLVDIRVTRNAFGRQVDSFETELSIPVLGDETFHAVFIRAPVIQQVKNDAKVLANLPDGRVIAVIQDKVLGTAFHPELTQDLRFHQYFLDIVTS